MPAGSCGESCWINVFGAMPSAMKTSISSASLVVPTGSGAARAICACGENPSE